MGQKNTDAAFDALYREQRSAVIRLCMLYLHDETLAEDAAQETFYKVYKGLHGFHRRSDIRTWVTRIAINTCKDILRRRNPVPLDDLTAEPSYTDDRDVGLSLTAAIAALPPKLRETVILYYYRELPQKDIARLLGVSLSAVAKRLERARAQLKELLGEDFDE